MLSVPYFEKALYELPEHEVTPQRISELECPHAEPYTAIFTIQISLESARRDQLEFFSRYQESGFVFQKEKRLTSEKARL